MLEPIVFILFYHAEVFIQTFNLHIYYWEVRLLFLSGGKNSLILKL